MCAMEIVRVGRVIGRDRTPAYSRKGLDTVGARGSKVGCAETERFAGAHIQSLFRVPPTKNYSNQFSNAIAKRAAKMMQGNPDAIGVKNIDRALMRCAIWRIVKYSWDDGWHHGLPY